MSRRQGTYLAIRAAAAVTFVLASTVLPRGLPAGLLVMAAGVAAVLSCIGVNAGAAGERAGARPQDRWFDSVRAPQGQWPPYEPGPDSTSPSPRATSGPPAAS
jgi:hypothetical protein